MTSLLLVGAGRMGSALLARWQQKNLSISVIQPSASLPGAFPSLDAYSGTPDIVLLAIKPQMLDAELPHYAKRFGTTPLYISIAAGRPVSFYEKHFGNAKIVRAMPNTPAMIGEGMTGLFANALVTAPEKQTATALFDAVGKTIWLESEEQMHALSAISGSGPAFVFAFMEALVDAGVKAGLSKDAATALVLQTFKGASELAATSSDSFAKLRENVTSPGGMTAAALSIYKEQGLGALVNQAVEAAIKRSKEL